MDIITKSLKFARHHFNDRPVTNPYYLQFSWPLEPEEACYMDDYSLMRSIRLCRKGLDGHPYGLGLVHLDNATRHSHIQHGFEVLWKRKV